jgi:glycogen debranching enzyme
MKTIAKRLLPGLAAAAFLLVSPGPAAMDYPWKDVYIGALDGSSWCGLVLAAAKDTAFAFRFRVTRDGRLADGKDLFYLVSEVGPNAPDNTYARVRFDLGLPVLPADEKDETPILIKPSARADTLTLEWSRQDERTVIGRIQGPKGADLQLLPYFPWDFKGTSRLGPDGQVEIEMGGTRPAAGAIWTDRAGAPVAPANGDGPALDFSPEGDRFVYFVAGVGDSPQTLGAHMYRFKNRHLIESLLVDEEDRYRRKRLRIDGLYEGAPESITNNLHWMLLYQPGQHRLYTPAGRRWIFDRPDGGPDHWQIFAWDSFFNALELVLESPRAAMDAVRAVLETQYPNGNIPNWRSRFGGTPDRSQPPVGAYVVLKLFQRTGDKAFLESAYPYLVRWHAFWKTKKPNGQARRDGNGDGLLEWGSDRELVAEKVPEWEVNAPAELRAKWESGQDDLPNWDDVPASPDSGTFTMNCLDLNCLYALDAWSLAQAADILDKPGDNETYLREYERMKELINTNLWNSREGFYFDRYWDGRWSTRKAASNFFPLLARIPDERRAQLMLRHLLNPKEFWGEYVLPTISRDDPAFNDPKNPGRQYWRGTIWPPTNYLVYQGLKAYGFDPVAAEFARKSASLFLRSWTNFQLCPENFHPLTGEFGGNRYQSWGPLFALIGVEEYLDFTPWEGFRFGMIQPERSGTLSGASIQGRTYEVEAGSGKLILSEDDKEIFSADTGLVVRHFLYDENEVRFETKAVETVTIKVRFLKKGKFQLLIDDRPKKIFTGSSVKFDVPDGDHAVLIQLLESLD